MKNTTLLFLITVLTCGMIYANPFNDAVFRVDFGEAGFNDTTSGNVSQGTAQNVVIEDVIELVNGNGKAAVFNGSTSGINYGLGANNELKIEGAFTNFVRIMFTDTVNAVSGTEYSILGRFGDSSGVNKRAWYLYGYRDTENGNFVMLTASISYDGTNGVNLSLVKPKLITGKFYDMYMRYQPPTFSTDGFMSLDIYDPNTSTKVFNASQATNVSSLYDSDDISFWVGYRGDYSSKIPFYGKIEQVGVWNRSLTDGELKEISGWENPLTTRIFNVDFNNSVDDTTEGNVSIGTATDVSYVPVELLPNGNGMAGSFNGQTSMINYGLGANNELKQEDALTYHVRVKYNTLSGERFLAGRFGTTDVPSVNRRVSLLNTISGQPYMSIAWAGGNGTSDAVGSTTGVALTTDKFYDIFMVFEPTAGVKFGYGRIVVLDPVDLQQVQTMLWGANFSNLFNASNINFWIGARGDYGSKVPLSGLIEQVNVWDVALGMEDMKIISGMDSSDGIPPCSSDAVLKMPGDINRDCYVDIEDLKLLSQTWLEAF